MSTQNHCIRCNTYRTLKPSGICPDCLTEAIDIYRRPDGSLYLNIPRRDGEEQYGIDWNDVHRLYNSTSDLLSAMRDEPYLEPAEPTEVGE